MIDHVGYRGEDALQDAADVWRAPGTTVVIRKKTQDATIYVVSPETEETLTVVFAGRIKDGWRPGEVLTCDKNAPYG